MKIRVADYIANFLVENGVTDGFSVTGGGAMHLNDGLGKKKGLKITYNHHEQASSICAESYARIHNRIAVLCVTTGPGGTNALTGVMGAYVDSIPMLVLSGQVKFSTTIHSTDVKLRQLGDQEFDIINSVQNMTKYAEMVTDANKIAYHLEKAFYLANNGRKGPCWLDIPLNIQGAIIETDDLIHYEKEVEEGTPNKISISKVDEVVDLLKNAKRPLVLAGTGIRLTKTYKEYREFLEKAQIPSLTAWNNNDLLPDENKYYAGRPGTVGNRMGNFALQNCDVLLVLGCRLNIRIISYNYENFAKNAKIIMVDIDENELKKPTLNIDYKIHADLKDFMPKLLDRYNGEGRVEWLNYIDKLKKIFPKVEKEYYAQEKVNAYCFIDEFTRNLSEGDAVICANGSACVMTFQAATIKEDQRYYTNSGCASMGYGLPAAVGATIARGKETYCIEGDGSLQMNIQELQTIVQNKLPLKVIVLNNSGYHSIRQTQKNFFGTPLVGVGVDSDDLSFPDLEKIAYAYNIPYVKIDNMTDMGDKVKDIIAHKGYMLVEVVVNDFPFTPKLSSRKLPDGSMVSASLEDMFPFIDRELYDELMICNKK